LSADNMVVNDRSMGLFGWQETRRVGRHACSRRASRLTLPTVDIFC
jgi:hypothetical protein